MKKWIIVPTALIVLAILIVYAFLPKKINLAPTVHIKCTAEAAERYLADDSKWIRWWPTNESPDDPQRPGSFSFKDLTFEPRQKMFNAIGVRITDDALSINSTMIIVAKDHDSVLVQWNAEYNAGSNPFTRVQRNLEAGRLTDQMSDILTRLKQFLEKDENVYGIAVKKNIVTDTLLLAAKKVFASAPTTRNIYSLVNKLKEYIQQQGARETGYPMLNILKKDSAHFETMVAIPVNKEVKEQNDILIKKMVPGYILEAEVSGGAHTAAHAFAQMEIYVTDHRYESPAIPFYSLITDRIAETDTTKWVTRISYPVF